MSKTKAGLDAIAHHSHKACRLATVDTVASTVSLPPMTREEEAERATAILRGKAVRCVTRRREQEVVIEFEDGAQFLADSETALELSITLPDDS